MTTGFITLLIYIIVLVPLMLLGYYFARRKMFDPHHKMVMTSVVILNWILIWAVMATSYAGVAEGLPDNLNENFALIPTIHGIIGLIAQLMATYLVLLMWTENTRFERLVIYRIKNIKTPMRITLSLWLITVLFGFGVYSVWYGDTSVAEDDAPEPAITEEAQVDETSDEAIIPDPAATEDAELDDADHEAPEPATTEESE